MGPQWAMVVEAAWLIGIFFSSREGKGREGMDVYELGAKSNTVYIYS